MTTDRNRRASAQQIADDYRALIESGRLGPGDRLPFTRELIEEYGTTGETVRQAIIKLRNAGLVDSRQGSGVYVRDISPFAWDITRFERGDRPDNAETSTDAWAAGIVEQGHEPGEKLLYVTRKRLGEKPPAEVTDALELGADELAVCRRRLRYVDGEPYQLSVSWFPARIALDTPLMNRTKTALPGGILAHIGHPQIRGRDRFRSRPANGGSARN
ncbi:GntR family transcriptional regulator [Streptomyces globisporus]|uniref:GntR family transcriptional regulator n=1 Tax=Streptomyces globisporus TaxID=1908 RepID=A0A927BLJ0_STRGL|nr:GntR family transcriptional regulator [Streptomyces globisporus]